jgi:hypothetical protein
MYPLSQISAILITKEKKYPESVLEHIKSFGFGEIILLTECEGIFRRFEVKPRFSDVYVQDDDCISDIAAIYSSYNGKQICCGMTRHHLNFYSKSRICLIGHGAFFPWAKINVLKKYLRLFGKDHDYLIETDRIFTSLNYPQKRVEVDIMNLPSFDQPDRLSKRKEHADELTRIDKKMEFAKKYLLVEKSVTSFFTVSYTSVICRTPLHNTLLNRILTQLHIHNNE